MSHLYTAVVYESTGFNAVNIPADRSVIQAAATSTHTCTGLTLTQQKWLDTIDLPLHWSAVNNADYMMIYAEDQQGQSLSTSWCYFVTSARMVAEDVAELSLLPDFLTSKGISNIRLIDGITVRSTYALNNVPPAELDQGDSYLAPSGRMELHTEWHGEGNQGTVLLESTIDIVGTAHHNEAITATDTVGGGNVAYPIPEYVSPEMFTEYLLSDGNTQHGKTFSTVGSTLIDPSFAEESGNVTIDFAPVIKLGLGKIRGLGLEGCLLNQYYLPKKYGEPTTEVVIAVEGPEAYYISEVTGNIIEEATGANSDVDLIMDTSGTREAGVLNFSDYAKYGLMTASGEGMEADPKDLMVSNTNPVLKIIADPRPEGKPYFRFKYINNLESNDHNFFRNCVAGLPWKKLPLVFTQASGSVLNTINFESSRRNATYDYTQQSARQNQSYIQSKAQNQLAQNFLAPNAQAQILGTGTGAITSSLITPAAAGVGIAGAGAAMGIASTIMATEQQAQSIALSQYQNKQSYDLATQQLMQNYDLAKLNDEIAYGIQQHVVTPTVLFPYNTETLRDFFGNGCLVYRYWYNADDVARIKKILRAYGAKYTMAIEPQHLQIPSGASYTYIEATGVSIGGDMPQWQAEGIALQLSNGVRIWNTKPVHIV